MIALSVMLLVSATEGSDCGPAVERNWQEEVRASEEVRKACAGAERDLFSAYWTGKLIDLEFSGGAPREQALCYIRAVAGVTFDSSDEESDQWSVNSRINGLVIAYRPSAYDFFAAQMKTSPERIHRGLREALLAHGQPEAMEEYFAARRVQVREKQPAMTLIAPYQYQEMLETGGCMVRPCSAHVNDLLTVVAGNLDIVENDIEVVTGRWPAACAAPRFTQPLDETRTIGNQVLQLIERILRGEATIGKIRKPDMWRM